VIFGITDLHVPGYKLGHSSGRFHSRARMMDRGDPVCTTTSLLVSDGELVVVVQGQGRRYHCGRLGVVLKAKRGDAGLGCLGTQNNDN